MAHDRMQCSLQLHLTKVSDCVLPNDGVLSYKIMKHHVGTSSIIDLVRMTKSHLTSCFVIQNELIMDSETNTTLRNYVFQIDIVSYYEIKSQFSFRLTE